MQHLPLRQLISFSSSDGVEDDTLLRKTRRTAARAQFGESPDIDTFRPTCSCMVSTCKVPKTMIIMYLLDKGITTYHKSHNDSLVHQPLKGYLRGVLPAPDCTALVSVQAATEELVLVGLSKPSIRSSDEAHGREARRNEVYEVYIRYSQVPPACPAETDRSTGERPAVLSLLPLHEPAFALVFLFFSLFLSNALLQCHPSHLLLAFSVPLAQPASQPF